MQAIGEAASRQSMRFVAVKSTAQQDVQASDRHFKTGKWVRPAFGGGCCGLSGRPVALAVFQAFPGRACRFSAGRRANVSLIRETFLR
jgi:hypothetical protein